MTEDEKIEKTINRINQLELELRILESKGIRNSQLEISRRNELETRKRILKTLEKKKGENNVE